MIKNNKTNKITNNFNIIKECKCYYMSIYTKFPTDPQEQKSLLEDLGKKSK